MPTLFSSSPVSCDQCILGASCALGAIVKGCPGALTPLLRHQVLPEGEHLLRQGELGQSLCLVKTGLVVLGRTGPDGEEQPLGFVGQGHVLGVHALAGLHASVWARAEYESTVCLLPVDALPAGWVTTALAAWQPLVEQSVNALIDWAVVSRKQRVKSRVMAALQLLRASQGRRRVLCPRQSHLAKVLGITRESLGRALAELEAERAFVRLNRTLLELQDPSPVAAVGVAS